MITNSYQIWQVAKEINAHQCVLCEMQNAKFHLTYVHTLPCNVTRDRIVTKYCNFKYLSAKTHSRSEIKTIICQNNLSR